MVTTATRLRDISLVCVPTIEQDRAVAFYESLGFEKRTDTPFGGGYRCIEVYPPEGTAGIALAPPPPGQDVTRVSDVTAFIVRATEAADPAAYVTFPEQSMDRQRLTGAFDRFGLPGRLE